MFIDGRKLHSKDVSSLQINLFVYVHRKDYFKIYMVRQRN